MSEQPQISRTPLSVQGIFYIAILFIPRGVYKDEMPIVVLSLVCR